MGSVEPRVEGRSAARPNGTARRFAPASGMAPPSGQGAGDDTTAATSARRERTYAPASAVTAAAGRTHGREGRFWNELYWFVVITLMAWTVGALAIPPRALETLALWKEELRYRNELQAARLKERTFEQAIDSAENDPYYREALFREQLHVKRGNEIYLAPAP